MRLKTIYYFSDASLYPHQSEGFTAPAPSTWIEVISLVYRAQRSPPSDQNRKRLKGHCKHKNLFAERNCLQIILDLMLINLHTHTHTCEQEFYNYSWKPWASPHTSTETQTTRIQQETKFRLLLGNPGKWTVCVYAAYHKYIQYIQCEIVCVT